MTIWALLCDTEAQFVDLGSDYYANRTNPERRARHHIRELQALGYTVSLQGRVKVLNGGSERQLPD